MEAQKVVFKTGKEMYNAAKLKYVNCQNVVNRCNDATNKNTTTLEF